MSFATFPASLPYFEELTNNELFEKLVTELSGPLSVENLKISEAEHPFMEAFETVANYKLTTNGALTNATTRDDILDLYYGIQAVDLRADSSGLFEKAWEQDPDMALHIIFYARSIHRGKSVTGPFFKAYGWLLQNHPRTAIANLHVLIDGTIRTGSQLAHWRKTTDVENDGWDVMEEETEEKYELLERRDFKTHGYWKDLCTMLTIYCQGELNGPADSDYLALKWPRQKFDARNYRIVKAQKKRRYKKRQQMDPLEAKKDAEMHIALGQKNNEEQKLIAQQQRRDTRIQRKKVVSDLLETDKTYRALHFTVARLFADQLKKDMQQMESNRVLVKGKYALGFNLSLAAKWAPSLGASHDKHTLLATTIAEMLFPPHEYQDQDESRVHYLNKARELYRKRYLVPLRSALQLAEHFMQKDKWDQVDLGHIPAVALQKNMKHFFEHAPHQVMQYMERVALGERKVSGETIGVYDLVDRVRVIDGLTGCLWKIPEDLREEYKKVEEQLINGQWKTLYSALRDTSLIHSSSKDESKKKAVDLGECIAICDISGSMRISGLSNSSASCMDASIGLSLLIANLAKPPFRGAIITFNRNPRAVIVDTNDAFTDQVRTVIRRSFAGDSTNLAGVFTDVLLPMAKKHNLAPEDMVKRLFVFSDMEFDYPGSGTDDFKGTTQEFIKTQFNEAGYEMPELVWWNLCSKGTYSSFSDMNAPVTKNDVDVALLSGFSASMLKTFLDGDIPQHDEEKSEAEKEAEKEMQAKKKETAMGFAKKAVYHESFNSIVVVD